MRRIYWLLYSPGVALASRYTVYSWKFLLTLLDSSLWVGLFFRLYSMARRLGQRVWTTAAWTSSSSSLFLLDLPWPLAKLLNSIPIQICGVFQSCWAGILDYFLWTNLLFCFLDINVMSYELFYCLKIHGFWSWLQNQIPREHFKNTVAQDTPRANRLEHLEMGLRYWHI